MRQGLLLAAVTAGTFATVAVAQVDPAQAFTLTFNPATSISSIAAPAASGTLDFDFVETAVENQVQLNLTIRNTSANANTRLVGVGFDLPSLFTKFTFSQLGSPSAPLNRLFGNQALTTQPVRGLATISAPTQPSTYPTGGFDVGIRSGGNGASFEGGNPGGGLTRTNSGSSTLVSFLLEGAGLNTAKQAEGLFYWGFFNVDGNGFFKTNQLRSALRFRTGSGSSADNEILLAKSTAVPTPALLPALLGLGAGLLRKKQQAEQEV